MLPPSWILPKGSLHAATTSALALLVTVPHRLTASPHSGPLSHDYATALLPVPVPVPVWAWADQVAAIFQQERDRLVLDFGGMDDAELLEALHQVGR